MLPRSSRLRQTKEIQHVVRAGRRQASSYVRLYSMPGATDESRVACVVGKTVHRSAVRRHRYQRWLREVFKKLNRERPLLTPYDMVWVAQPGITQAASLEEVYQDLSLRWEELRPTH